MQNMKRIFHIIAAGVALFTAFSCVKEETKVIYDLSNATAPVLGSWELTKDGVTAAFTPATFGFNDKMVAHTLALVSIDGSAVNESLGGVVKEGKISVGNSALTKALLAQGEEEGSLVSFELAIRASMPGAKDYIDSKDRISISDYELAKGNPWGDFTETSPWTLIGAIESLGMNWDSDYDMYANGNKHVARGVTLKTTDQFKFRKDKAWGENYGGEGPDEPWVLALDTECPVFAGGKNFGVPADGIYDLLLDRDANTVTLSEAYLTYPDYTEVSTWGVTGSIASAGISWDLDVQMITNGEWHVAEGVVLTTADQFKFRKDRAWGENFGGEGSDEPFVMQVDVEYTAVAGGKNLGVPADGVYDLFLNPDAQLIKIVESLGGKSPVIGGDTPEPPTPAVTGWNIIGLNGDWDNDVIASQDGNVWTAYVTAVEATNFKWRKDGAWDEEYGGTLVTLGEPFEAVAGGPNIEIPAGFWKVVLNLDDNTITVSNGQVWSLIGVNGNWDTDIDMTLTDDKWVSPVTKIAGEFKLRENHAWSNDRGGTFVAVGSPFEAVAGGPNINVEEGNYVVTYDPATETIVIDETGWGLVGTINGWGSTPDIILKEEGLFLVARNVALTADDEIKLRYQSDWGVNRGGRTAVGHAVKAIQDAGNIKPGVAGNYDIWYRPDSEVIFVMDAGSVLTYWGVVGSINGWGAPDRIMYENEKGEFVYEDLEITAADEIKIRQNEQWSVDRGGTFAELGEAFAVSQGGPNVKVGRDAKVTVVYDPTAETFTLDGEYTGDAPSLPETMYIIGEAIGGWEWSGDYIVDMVPVNGQAGQFWAIRHLEAGKPFKFCAVKEWSGDFTGLGEDSGYTVADGNCSVTETGVYMIYVDVANKKLCIEPAKVYGIGDCFGGWDQGMESALFSTADGKASVTVSAAGDLRMYAASSIATSDWWTREFIILDGKIAYRGNGGDQERVHIAAGAKVTLDFNAGTGVIE